MAYQGAPAMNENPATDPAPPAPSSTPATTPGDPPRPETVMGKTREQYDVEHRATMGEEWKEANRAMLDNQWAEMHRLFGD
jgi:hypothetical protein